MRPKFRLWDSINDRWFTEYYDVFIDQYGELFSESMRKSDTPNIEIDVMGNLKYMELSLSTGLKDKNGVEIYEGDVVVYTDKRGQKKIGKINYTNAKYYIGNFETLGYASEQYELEVIGDIYQTPELIKNET